MEMGEKMNKEALVVCSDKSTCIGITVWDLETGEQLLHIPTCAAAPHGLFCLRNQFIVASQSNRHGSFGGGSIFIWPLNKPQSPLRSYTLEAMGPISCTKDGLYIAGGAPSGNAYLWEVTSGRLLRTWHAHHKSLKCMVFSDDDSLLLFGCTDGIISVWSMISLVDVEDSGSSPSLLYYSSEHRSSITGLVTMSAGARSIFISSSLDGTCKVWELVSGRHLQTLVYPMSVTAIALHPLERLLFSGSVDGNIFVNVLDIGAVEDCFITTEDQAFVLKVHNESITALTFSGFHLISASEDFTFCLWDTINRVVLRRFNNRKVLIVSHLKPSKSYSSIPGVFAPKVSSAFQPGEGDGYIPFFSSFPQQATSHSFPWKQFARPFNIRFRARRTNTCYAANEIGEKHRRSTMGNKHDKACNGDKQAFAMSFAGYDAVPVAMQPV
ncbi:hypothetical protein ERO13_D03G113300v2 [Gossypium hirsutum]|nr:hypothetical protein ERO13_D03G113300v2 [Gossypium hirsutum]